jgi:hypothetical protein
MTPKEFQKLNLAVELKAGKKRLEDALHGLSDEQCERAGATRSGSVVELLSEMVTKEFLALMEVSDRLPSLPMNLLANADGRTSTASGAEKDIAKKSVDNLLAEFGVLRSAVIRRIEGRRPQEAKFDAKHAYVADVCVTRFNELIDEIEHWRSSEIVGFSAARLRAEAREAELNQAIVDLSREDFLAGNFDLKSLFSLQFDRFYSEDFAARDGAGFHCIVSRNYERTGRRGEFHHRLGDPSRRKVFDRHSRLLAHGAGVEEPHGHCGTHRGSRIDETVSYSMIHASMLELEERRIFEELISRFDSLTEAQMSAVGVTPEWSAKDLLAHLAYWERAAAGQVREFEAGRWSAKKRTRAQIERINREVVSANQATPRRLLREELILARSEIVAAMKRAPGELEERSPLARIVYFQCVRHRGHHLEQLLAWVVRLGKTL